MYIKPKSKQKTLPNGWPIPRNWQLVVFLLFLSLFWYCAVRGGSPFISMIDMFNLMVHEGGHTLFTPLGTTMHFLGGTILQCVPPIACVVVFSYQKRPASIAICGAWLGQNLLNISTYQADARDKLLPLVGGGVHDWYWLFTRFGILEKYKTIAGATVLAGWLVMLLFAGWYVWRWVDYNYINYPTENASQRRKRFQ